jgi:glycosyltransferase involved in cell wall biosynthesis
MFRSRRLVLIVPGRLDAPTGGSVYDRRIAAALGGLGWHVDVREIDRSFPLPTAAARHEAAQVLASIPDGTAVLIDGLAFGAMADEAERESVRLRLIALVHLPLADAIGPDKPTTRALEDSERRALASAAQIIVTGRSTVTALERYGGRLDRITVVEPGTDRAPLARGAGDPALLHLVCVATLAPGKGHDVLLRTLTSISHSNWRLTCAGSPDRHPETAAWLRAKVATAGLDDRVHLAGELSPAEIADLYDRADLFVLPTLHETYGMAVAEAIARGLPVVSTTTGAIPDLVGPSAGLLVPPGDADALASALSAVLGDPLLRARLAAGAALMRGRLPTWDDAGRTMSEALDRVAGHG